MTTEQLKERYLGAGFKSYGHFKIGFVWRGKEYYSVTTNTMAIDRIDDEMPERTNKDYYVTQKQALTDLYNEVKRANGI